MRILIAGCRGQLGRDCTELWSGRHEVAGCDLPELDIADPAGVEETVRAVRPDVLLNAAAFTRVDDCETRIEDARRTNAEGPGLLAAAARRHGARFFHISTDYVFDGRRAPPRPYLESDPPAPLSAYGRTKLDGERAVQAAGGRFVILRTAWLYGIGGRNFPKTMLRLALRSPDRPLRAVVDQFGSPTWSHRLACQIDRLLDEPEAEGVFHATAAGHASWYDFARAFLEDLGVPHRIEPCGRAEFPAPAPRPVNSILDNARLREAGWNVMRDWRVDLKDFAARYRDRLLEEARSAP